MENVSDDCKTDSACMMNNGGGTSIAVVPESIDKANEDDTHTFLKNVWAGGYHRKFNRCISVQQVLVATTYL